MSVVSQYRFEVPAEKDVQFQIEYTKKVMKQLDLLTNRYRLEVSSDCPEELALFKQRWQQYKGSQSVVYDDYYQEESIVRHSATIDERIFNFLLTIDDLKVQWCISTDIVLMAPYQGSTQRCKGSVVFTYNTSMAPTDINHNLYFQLPARLYSHCREYLLNHLQTSTGCGLQLEEWVW